MKKVEVEKLVSKSIIVTVILLCIILGTTLIQNGYFNALAFTATSKVTSAISIVFAIVAVAMVVLAVIKNPKYYLYASLSAVLAIFVMLLKVNYEINGLEFNVGARTVKFYIISIALACILILTTWIKTTVKLIKG